jgi:hypothetical protein
MKAMFQIRNLFTLCDIGYRDTCICSFTPESEGIPQAGCQSSREK